VRAVVKLASSWLALVVASACGRVGFDWHGDGAAGDGAADDSTAGGVDQLPPGNVTRISTIVAHTINSSAVDTFTAQVQQAGHAIVILAECDTVTVPASVSLAAPGWSITPLAAMPIGGSGKYAMAFGAIAPDTVSATFTVTWPLVCSTMDELGDELANVDPTGGATTFRGLMAGITVGNCTTSVTTSGTNDMVWAGCSGGGTLTGVGAGYMKGADDGHDDWTAYRATSDPPGTVEQIVMTDSSSTAISAIAALTIKAQ
jgi:hypothetical protein